MTLPPPKPKMAEVAPNKWVQLDLDYAPPEIVLADVVPTEDGKFKLVPRSWERLERVTSDLCVRLGLGPDTLTLRRLIRAGFVDGARISPKLYNVNIAAFFRHMNRCAKDPGFWEKRDNYRLFREVHF